MKKILIIGYALMTAHLASAETSFNLPKGYTTMTAISGEVFVSPLCPPNAMCIQNGTQISIEFTINCTDKFGPITHSVVDNPEAKTIDVFVSAYKLQRDNGMKAVCLGMPVENYHISLPNKYGDVKVHFLGVDGQE